MLVRTEMCTVGRVGDKLWYSHTLKCSHSAVTKTSTCINLKTQYLVKNNVAEDYIEYDHVSNSKPSKNKLLTVLGSTYRETCKEHEDET